MYDTVAFLRDYILGSLPLRGVLTLLDATVRLHLAYSFLIPKIFAFLSAQWPRVNRRNRDCHIFMLEVEQDPGHSLSDPQFPLSNKEVMVVPYFMKMSTKILRYSNAIEMEAI